MDNETVHNISVIGMGKLGCTMLACFAAKGMHVIGVDVVLHIVDTINAGHSPIYEPKVDDLIQAHKANISATTSTVDAVLATDASFVIVPTPSITNGSFDMQYVTNVLTQLATALATKNTYHLVVITSTVLPGNMVQLQQHIEQVSGKQCGVHFGLCYNPDFIALGNIVHDFTHPDMVLIGEYDTHSGNLLQAIHHHTVLNTPRYSRMNFYNAELCKIAINSYCTLKITFANVIAEICEQLPGGDADVVTTALGADTRIGNKYIKGGLSYGGPCFPRDNRAFAWSAAQYGVQHVLSNQTDVINTYQRSTRIPNKILAILKAKGIYNIAILGVTYKADTTLVEESAGLYIIKALLEHNIHITLYDPAGIDATRKEIPETKYLTYASSIPECIHNQTVCMVAAPWPIFKTITEQDYLQHMATHPVLIDGWSTYNYTSTAALQYIKLGKQAPSLV